MRILLTGASSFTGYWFARALVEAGHEVCAPLRRSKGEYVGTRAERLAGVCSLRYETLFGGDRFLDLIRSNGPFDLLCQHAAEVKDYRSPSFDVDAAVGANTRNLVEVLNRLGDARVVLTGTVFEPNVNPYGQSKGQTTKIFRQLCPDMCHFVIPNPFGPFEQERFSAYLMREWAAGREAEVHTPEYIRDNIHVRMLAKAYATDGLQRDLSPSGYVETMAEFTGRYAREMRKRLGWECPFRLAKQSEFTEPVSVVGTDPVSLQEEERCWNELAEYYDSTITAGRLA